MKKTPKTLLLFETKPIENVKKEKIHIFEFERNLNNKFGCDIFSLILPISNKHKVGEKFCIKLRSQVFCTAFLITKEKLSIKEIISRGLFLLDSGISNNYFSYMENLYSKKKWWCGKETKFNYLILKKEIQLDLF